MLRRHFARALMISLCVLPVNHLHGFSFTIFGCYHLHSRFHLPKDPQSKQIHHKLRRADKSNNKSTAARDNRQKNCRNQNHREQKKFPGFRDVLPFLKIRTSMYPLYSAVPRAFPYISQFWQDCLLHWDGEQRGEAYGCNR